MAAAVGDEALLASPADSVHLVPLVCSLVQRAPSPASTVVLAGWSKAPFRAALRALHLVAESVEASLLVSDKPLLTVKKAFGSSMRHVKPLETWACSKVEVDSVGQ